MPARYITRPALRDAIDRHEQTVHSWTITDGFPKPCGNRGRTYLYSAPEVYAWLLRNKRVTPAEVEILADWEVSE